jgi:hypothetical protein
MTQAKYLSTFFLKQSLLLYVNANLLISMARKYSSLHTNDFQNCYFLAVHYGWIMALWKKGNIMFVVNIYIILIYISTLMTKIYFNFNIRNVYVWRCTKDNPGCDIHYDGSQDGIFNYSGKTLVSYIIFLQFTFNLITGKGDTFDAFVAKANLMNK